MEPDVIRLVEELKQGSRQASFALHDYVRERSEEDHSSLVPAFSEGLLDLETRDGCAFALECIGAQAKAAIPNLVTALQHDPDNWVISPFARALGAIGSDAESAIPAIIEMPQVVEDSLDTPELIEALVNIGISSPEVMAALERVSKVGFTEEIRTAAGNGMTVLRDQQEQN
ncbi:MAG: hypothetical protein AAGB04_09450 [Pseudomonadota bacterium]